jgi:hypothetical protein
MELVWQEHAHRSGHGGLGIVLRHLCQGRSILDIEELGHVG